MKVDIIDFSYDKLPLILNLTSVAQLSIWTDSGVNIGGIESSLVQFLISPLAIAMSVANGLKAVSSSVGIPAIFSDDTSFNEEYSIDLFKLLYSHLKLTCWVLPFETVTASAILHLNSVNLSSNPFSIDTK